MKRLLAAAFALLLSAVGGLGCLSGQTGSASSCAPAGACECANLENAHVAKGTVTAVNGRIVSVRVDQMIDDLPNSLQYAEQTVVGECGGACRYPAPALPVVGDQVFTTFDAQQPIPALDPCVANCGMPGFVCTQPWGDDVRLADGTAIPLADAVELATPGKCRERFPPPPCEGEHHTCSVSRAGGTSSPMPMPIVGLSVLLLAHARRRARK